MNHKIKVHGEIHELSIVTADSPIPLMRTPSFLRRYFEERTFRLITSESPAPFCCEIVSSTASLTTLLAIQAKDREGKILLLGPIEGCFLLILLFVQKSPFASSGMT